MKRNILQIIIVAFLFIIATISCKKEPVQGVTINGSLLIDVGETAKLTPTFIPSNAYNKKVSWESSNPDVATVDNEGNVTGKSIGITIIKVISEDSGRTAQCVATVIQPIEPEEMIWVEGGTFRMGANDGVYWTEDELPRHEVTLNGFYISKYLVTQKEWSAAMGNEGATDGTKGDKNPAWIMRWNDVQEYISRLNAHTGKNYRLPTEAEWEYAARGGTQSMGYQFSGSDNINEVAWYDGNYTASKPLHPVGQKKPNELGIYDMSGNMWEWCSDYWGKYIDLPQTNPTGPPTGAYRVVRGGAFFSDGFLCRNAYRYYMSTDIQVACGFRLVLPAEQKKD